MLFQIVPMNYHRLRRNNRIALLLEHNQKYRHIQVYIQNRQYESIDSASFLLTAPTNRIDKKASKNSNPLPLSQKSSVNALSKRINHHNMRLINVLKILIRQRNHFRFSHHR